LRFQKDFRAQKVAISASKKFFVHKRPPFRHQKSFSCTKCRSLGLKKDSHAQNVAVWGRNEDGANNPI